MYRSMAPLFLQFVELTAAQRSAEKPVVESIRSEKGQYSYFYYSESLFEWFVVCYTLWNADGNVALFLSYAALQLQSRLKV